MGERQYSGECGAVCLKVDRAHMTHFQLAYWYVSSHPSCNLRQIAKFPCRSDSILEQPDASVPQKFLALEVA